MMMEQQRVTMRGHDHVGRITRDMAIDLNNRGVRMIRMNDFNGAIVACAKALNLMKKKDVIQHDHQHHHQHVDDDTAITTAVECTTSATAHDTPTTSTTPHASGQATNTRISHQQKYCHSDGKASCGPGYVFCSPIEIPKNDTNISSSGSHVETGSLSSLELSLMITFNIGLAYHLLGIRNLNHNHNHNQSTDSDSGNTGMGKSQQLELHKATRLYECVYKTCHTQNVSLCLIHSMGLINNLGHVHWVLNHTYESQKCFEQLLETLMYYVDCRRRRFRDDYQGGSSHYQHPYHSDHHHHPGEIEQQLQGFFANASLLSNKHQCITVVAGAA